jgi:hypothetical protein
VEPAIVQGENTFVQLDDFNFEEFEEEVNVSNPLELKDVEPAIVQGENTFVQLDDFNFEEETNVPSPLELKDVEPAIVQGENTFVQLDDFNFEEEVNVLNPLELRDVEPAIVQGENTFVQLDDFNLSEKIGEFDLSLSETTNLLNESINILDVLDDQSLGGFNLLDLVEGEQEKNHPHPLTPSPIKGEGEQLELRDNELELLGNNVISIEQDLGFNYLDFEQTSGEDELSFSTLDYVAQEISNDHSSLDDGLLNELGGMRVNKYDLDLSDFVFDHSPWDEDNPWEEKISSRKKNI